MTDKDPQNHQHAQNTIRAEEPATTSTTPSQPAAHPADKSESAEQMPDLRTYTAAQAEDSVLTDTPTGKKKFPIRALILALLVLSLLGFVGYGLRKTYAPIRTVTVQGQVEGESVQVSTKIPSRIEQVLVHEGDQVTQGQILVKLSSPEITTKQQQAQAALKSARALQATAERGTQPENLATLYANWQSSLAQAQLANQTYTRGNYLYQQGVIARQRRDEMYAAKKSADALSEAAHQQYLRGKRGATSEQKVTADAQVELAQAALDEANALQAETELRAPIAGTVSNVYGQSSELVATAVPVVTILQQERWVTLNVREDQYASIDQHQTLDGFIPALNRQAAFKIVHVDAEGDFATIKTTRQTGGYDIRSFRFKLVPTVEIPELKVGMSVIFHLKQTHSSHDST